MVNVRVMCPILDPIPELFGTVHRHVFKTMVFLLAVVCIVVFLVVLRQEIKQHGAMFRCVVDDHDEPTTAAIITTIRLSPES